jgi:hypothetical protein
MSAIDRALVESLGRRLAERPEILEAYLFGSQARGLARRHSDVDVAVYVNPACQVDAPFGYEAALTAELLTLLRCNDVDVVVLNRASPLLYHRVLRDGVRLFTRAARVTTTREGLALSRYCDYLLQLRKIDVAHGTRIEDGSFGR